MIYQKYKLNLIPDKVPVNVWCSQFDVGTRTFQFEILNGAEAYEIPSGSVVTVRGTKADNTGFEYQCTFTDNVANVIVQDQMTVINGTIPCELRITNSDEIIGTANFNLVVEKTPLDPEVTISDTYLPLLEDAEQNAIRAEAAADQAETVLASAVKSVNYVLPDTNGNVNVSGTLPVGGTTGQVLTKQSNADGDADWEDASADLSAGVGISIANDVVSNTAPIWHGDEAGDLPVPIDADLLQGHQASYYQLQYEDVWTNPDSTSDFGNQTINLGHTNILGVTIKFLEQKTNLRLFAKTVFRSVSNQTSDMFLGLCFTTAPYILFQRPFNINFAEGTISFQAAYAMPTYATYGSVQNNYAIPLSVTIYYQR